MNGRSYRLKDRPGDVAGGAAGFKTSQAPPARRESIRVQNQPKRPPAPKAPQRRRSLSRRGRTSEASKGSKWREGPKAASRGKRKPADA